MTIPTISDKESKKLLRKMIRNALGSPDADLNQLEERARRGDPMHDRRVAACGVVLREGLIPLLYGKGSSR